MDFCTLMYMYVYYCEYTREKTIGKKSRHAEGEQVFVFRRDFSELVKRKETNASIISQSSYIHNVIHFLSLDIVRTGEKLLKYTDLHI